MSAPFFACTPSSWPRMVGFLVASGQPWERDDAISDLRWHVDQRKTLPSRATLSERWRWSERSTRALLADVATWWDPTKGQAPTTRDELEGRTRSKSRSMIQSRSSSDPAVIRDRSSEERANAEKAQEVIQDRSSSDPAPIHPMSTGACLHLSPPPLTSTSTEEQQGAAPPEPPGLFPPAVVEDKPQQPVSDEPSPRKPKQTKRAKTIAPLASELWALLRSDVADLQPGQHWSDAVMAATRVSGRTEQDARIYADWMLNSGDRFMFDARLLPWPWLPKNMPGRLATARAWALGGRQTGPPAQGQRLTARGAQVAKFLDELDSERGSGRDFIDATPNQRQIEEDEWRQKTG